MFNIQVPNHTNPIGRPYCDQNLEGVIRQIWSLCSRKKIVTQLTPPFPPCVPIDSNKPRPWFWDPSGNNYDMNVTPNILPGTSIVYFGNYVALMEGTAVVDANGFTQQSDISIYNEDPAAYGEDPNTITQVVSGLTVGKRYR